MRAIILTVLVLLGGCAAIDPLGSPQLQEREEGTVYSGDYPTEAGVICRELVGQASVRDINGTARGVRCLKVGNEPFPGCLQWEFPGGGYQSEGCLDGN